MRRLVPVLVLVVLTFAVSADLRYDDSAIVYTSNKTAFTEAQVRPLLDRLLAQPKPLIVFIHGRGDEPSKSLEGTGFVLRRIGIEGKAVSKLESYGANVVMVSWDSNRGRGIQDRSRPLANIPRAQEKLSVVLDALAAALSARETANQTSPPVTLLAHSMGTIVLQEYVTRHQGWRPRGDKALFTNVIVSSSDADSGGHSGWVDQIAAVERVFVTINPADRVLGESAGERRRVAKEEARRRRERLDASKVATPLGAGIASDISQRATYVHIPRTKAHEIFTQDSGRPELATFFAAAFNGREISFAGPQAGAGRQVRLK